MSVEFGLYLKKIRKEKKLTVRQLDLYSGVSHSYISQLERGVKGIPSPDILRKLSKPLGVDYESLMEQAGYITLFDKENFIHEDKIGNELTNERNKFVGEVMKDFDRLPQDEQERVYKIIKAFLGE